MNKLIALVCVLTGAAAIIRTVFPDPDSEFWDGMFDVFGVDDEFV